MIPKEKRSKKLQWYYDNREYQISRNRQWKEDNHEQMLKQKKEYHLKNRESILVKKKIYRENNIEKIKQYRVDNKKRDHEKQKEYRKNNVEKEKFRHKKYDQEHPEKKLQHNINALKKLGNQLNISHFKVGMALKSWSQTIRKNNPNCAICGELADVSHHIIHKQYYPQLMLNLNNGIPLCKSHHHEVHWGRD